MKENSTKDLTKFYNPLVSISTHKKMDKKGASHSLKQLVGIHYILLDLRKYLEEMKKLKSLQ